MYTIAFFVIVTMAGHPQSKVQLNLGDAPDLATCMAKVKEQGPSVLAGFKDSMTGLTYSASLVGTCIRKTDGSI